ncbi:MAG TPA: dihydroorotate dehydrogenase electron transfer subunit [Oscillospiraceae bacterium]|nr:dihydroorotate dehydrogenase electron transfer subunit [Oscillospiraceae bacterium]HPF56429.1 dihydroorotate dehydrogenase electron transfer subunit [Clostridiales bacterium]HPK36571.1 dihydroorotate dehydrogenase electron transfer subunit [Oscillospiraceae bacterium]HPR76766.1 dihydroorotate dehydrogenase electron transfer subunit [Oscillospiraceae bacterium]
MNDRICVVAGNYPIARDVFRMKLICPEHGFTAPGQFLNIRIDGLYLRRPISICDWDEESVDIIYKVIGKGTEALSRMASGDELSALLPLGNGFDINRCGQKPLLIGGGVGTPPLYGLAKALIAQGKKPIAVLGFNNAEDAMLVKEFEALGVPVRVTTVDGTMGKKGFVTDAVKGLDYTDYCACGPEPMLKAVFKACPVDGQLSFEARMACGFGACMGCSCETKSGSKRICKDGPVLLKEDLLW